MICKRDNGLTDIEVTIFETDTYSEFFFDCRDTHAKGKLLGELEEVRTLRYIKVFQENQQQSL